MDQLTSLSLCSGGAGLDLGLQLILPIRTVCWVEWEAFAIDYLASAMEAGCLDQAPVWTDLRTFDGLPWRGAVDCLTAGYPCQPFSLAGKRGGQDDPRHLWPHVNRIIGEVEPTLVFLENVSGHLSLGFDQVVNDLETLGYQVAAGLFSAEEVGATHKRDRLFILALGDGIDKRLQGRSLPECARPSQQITWSGIGTSLFPPGPDETEAWLRIPKYLWPAIEPGICELVDGLARTEWLRLLGNGVVPLQAAYAFVSLYSAILDDATTKVPQ